MQCGRHSRSVLRDNMLPTFEYRAGKWGAQEPHNYAVCVTHGDRRLTGATIVGALYHSQV